MRARRRRKRKNNYNRGHRPERQETVYVQPPCDLECSEEPLKKSSRNKKSRAKGLKNFFDKFSGSTGSDDLLLIVLIVIIFLSRRNSETDYDDTSGSDEKEFSVTDFLSKASDILNRFNDNDILLIALLYILL
ncbi:MAG: hypothetical protein E7384_05335 [Ruminococcaceae bacterium]|nr:hypothetical protein [Oscillospiraceae bacterium]